jgi:hypothetical protein
MPPIREPLQIAFAAVLEFQIGSGDQVLHGGGDQHLGRPCHAADPGADADGDPADLAVDRLDLADVHPGANLEVERADGLDDRLRAPNGAGGTVERREEAVTRGVDLDAVVPA